LSGTKAITGAAATPPAIQRESEEDDGGAAVLAARDDRQMEEFRAAKRFNCTGREPGLYADVNTGCKRFIICHKSGRMGSFTCPGGTLFNQIHQVCDWQLNVDCR